MTGQKYRSTLYFLLDNNQQDEDCMSRIWTRFGMRKDRVKTVSGTSGQSTEIKTVTDQESCFKSQSISKKQLKKQKNEQAKKIALEEFQCVLAEYHCIGGPEEYELLIKFSNKGFFQKKLVYKYLKIQPTPRRKKSSGSRKLNFAEKMSRVYSMKPLQGGSPGLGNRR